MITSAFAQSVKETKRCNVENIINVSIGLHQACKYFLHDKVYRPTINVDVYQEIKRSDTH